MTLHVPDEKGNEATLARDLLAEAELAVTPTPDETITLSLSRRMASSYEATDGNLSPTRV